jgi:hypothetical protein
VEHHDSAPIPEPSTHGRKEAMINVEYIENGKRVIIPSEVWEAIKEMAEHAEIYELIQQRKDQAAVYTLNDILTEEGLSRADLEG